MCSSRSSAHECSSMGPPRCSPAPPPPGAAAAHVPSGHCPPTHSADDSSLLAILLDVSPTALSHLASTPGLGLQSLLEQVLGLGCRCRCLLRLSCVSCSASAHSSLSCSLY